MLTSKHNNETLLAIKGVVRQIKVIAILCIILLSITLTNIHLSSGSERTIPTNNTKDSVKNTIISDNFIIPPFDDSPEGKLAEYGHRLITETYASIGPETDHKITGNRLSCSSCHLNGDTKPHAAPYIGLTGLFPIYVGRENKIVSLEERINGCFERSMNGKAIGVNSTIMRAMISYIKHISRGTPVGQRLEGQGFLTMKIPERSANLKSGALVYKNTCASCHGDKGQGLLGTNGNRDGGYIYPQLWGEDTYNDGAGMSRILTAAKFIKGNMPLGVTSDAPQLSDEQAYDVAAYINSHDRPEKANKELDYPDLQRKPKDSPYPPYADNISVEQHKYGPFNF